MGALLLHSGASSGAADAVKVTGMAFVGFYAGGLVAIVPANLLVGWFRASKTLLAGIVFSLSIILGTLLAELMERNTYPVLAFSLFLMLTGCLLCLQRPPLFRSTPVLYQDKKYKIIGVIDRIDKCDDYFRIIDYKTGKSSSTFEDFSDVANGKKIQLFIYLMAFEKVSNKKPVGVFYMPILNSFSKEDCLDLYKLQGVMEESISTVLKFDDNLNEADIESKIVNVKTKKGNIVFTNKMINESDFHKISDYSFKMLKSACDDILKGVIEPYPLGKDLNSLQCKWCNYKAICGFSELYGNNYKVEKKVGNMEKFNEIIEGDADDK